MIDGDKNIFRNMLRLFWRTGVDEGDSIYRTVTVTIVNCTVDDILLVLCSAWLRLLSFAD